MQRISAAALINFFSKKCGAYLRAELNTIAIPLSTVFTRISAAALINSPTPQMRRLFEGGAYSSNYCNWELKSLLHLGLYYIQDRLLHLGLQHPKRFSTHRQFLRFWLRKLGERTGQWWQDNRCRLRTHEKNSGETARRLGTIIQNIFLSPIGSQHSLDRWKLSGESRYPGALPPMVENFRRAFSYGPTDCPWVSEDGHYPDLSSASDQLTQISHAARPITSTTQIWVVMRHQYGISALVSQTSFGGEISGSVPKCRLFSQASETVVDSP